MDGSADAPLCDVETLMKLLLVHNRYQQRGGEDSVFDFESSLLERAGHDVHRLIATNEDIHSIKDKIDAARGLTWNERGHALVVEAIDRVKPDVMHVHNFFALLSPSIYDAAAVANVPVVQTLHNFRITCANGLLLRDGSPCELCVEGSPLNAVRFRCYRGSVLASLALARMIAFHRRKGTWLTKVARFIVLSEFARSRFVAAGLPAEKIVVKPNGALDSDLRAAASGKAVLFVGRLSIEKGVRTLLEAAHGLNCPVRIAGDGPLRSELELLAPPNVTFLGRLSHDEVLSEMAHARCLVIPSISYEAFPVTLVEAYSVGLPVIASRLGSLIELVDDEITGLFFSPGDAGELARAIERLQKNGHLAAFMRQATRRRYEELYSPDRTVRELEAIYNSTMTLRAPISVEPHRQF